MNKKSLFIVMVVASVLVLPLVTKAQSTGSEADVALLRQQIETLKQQLAQLETRLATLQGSSQQTVTFTKDLAKGTEDAEVIKLQKFLAQYPEIYPEGLVTGYFGLLTETALKKWQVKQGIEATGVVDSQTRAKLNGIVASTSTSTATTGSAVEQIIYNIAPTSATTASGTTATCSYPAAPTGCSYVQGANYNATTQCGLALSCPTTVIVKCDYPAAPTGCSYIQGASYNATTQCGLMLKCTAATSAETSASSVAKTCQNAPSCTGAIYKGLDSSGCVIWECPAVSLSSGATSTPIRNCQNYPTCVDAIYQGVHPDGCIIWDCSHTASGGNASASAVTSTASAQSATIPYFSGSTPTPVYTAPVYTAPVYTAPVSSTAINPFNPGVTAKNTSGSVNVTICPEAWNELDKLMGW